MLCYQQIRQDRFDSFKVEKLKYIQEYEYEK